MIACDYIVKRVPKWIADRTQGNMDNWGMSLYDAFEESVREYPKLKKGSKLWNAWYNSDFREYIPSAYMPEDTDKRAASAFCGAIRKLADNEEALSNLENYLSAHFRTWLEKYANDPENLSAEMYSFANMFD